MVSRLEIPLEEVQRRLGLDNSWWRAGGRLESFTQRADELIVEREDEGGGNRRYLRSDIDALDDEFLNDLNHGGLREAVMSPVVREIPSRFLSQDIIDKVLLKELPSPYGISDTQALNRFFNVLASNTGDEVGLEALSKHSNDAPSKQE